jgi:glycosyltransferase involved in cell wall biosynthesis
MVMPYQSEVWLCFQLGARRHYADPRALYHAGKLGYLITDAWVPPTKIPSFYLPSIIRLRQRYHEDLRDAPVRAFTGSLINFELLNSLKKISGWERTIRRNIWFQKKSIEFLNSLERQFSYKSPPTVMAYSYAALDIFSYAKSKGWNTVLSQIDPGSVEEDIVSAEHQRYPEYSSNWYPAPSEYWKNWEKECLLADRIIVSSSWSSQALQKLSVPEGKIDVIPLAYEPSLEAKDFVRSYPQAFSNTRPLRTLFLGQVILRKGLVALLEAIDLLRDQPVEFWMVGASSLDKAKQTATGQNVKWFGSVPRNATTIFYQEADVFLFPTLSDGFGITQLEAQAWKLPIISSRFCGEVVQDKKNGLILPTVTGEAIASALQFCLNHPQDLEAFSKQSIQPSDFDLARLKDTLLRVPYDPV